MAKTFAGARSAARSSRIISSQSGSVSQNPDLGLQEYLINPRVNGIDLNIEAAWDDYTGAGIKVAVVDDGIDYRHPDLAPVADLTRDFDYRDNDADAQARAYGDPNSNDFHGTGVASVIAAANNAEGMVGVAFGARVSGLRLGFGAASSSAAQFARAVSDSVNFDISNNSWESFPLFGDDFTLNPAYRTALENGVTNGRGGLGTIYVFAAGNGSASQDNVNLHDLQSARQTIAVGAVQEFIDITLGGTRYQTPVAAGFTTPGSAVLVSAQGVDVYLADPVGSEGLIAGSYGRLNGTSFAAPMVSGVVALMLEANPDLGWRDVQKILAMTAYQFDPGLVPNSARDDLPSLNGTGVLTSQANGSTLFNGGGGVYSHLSGFGYVDATAAVRLAETWGETGTSATERRIAASASPNLAIGAPTASTSITVTQALEVQHVTVTLDLVHSWMDDLKITLISPSGTRSVLFALGNSASLFGWEGDTTASEIQRLGVTLDLDSVAHLGESSLGTWTLQIQDLFSTSDTGLLRSWTLEAFGDAADDRETIVFTDDFSRLAAGAPARRTLTGGVGLDGLNAAAVTSPTVLNFATGNGTIDGTPVTLSGFEQAWGGDAADRLTGATQAETLSGGRGADTLLGAEGADLLIGGPGNDILNGGQGTADVARYFGPRSAFRVETAGDGTTTVTDTRTGLTPGRQQGVDEVTGVETLQFNDGTRSLVILPEIRGSSRAETLRGTAAAEKILGLGRNDRLLSNGGEDQLFGGAGRDTLVLAAGAQTVVMGPDGGQDTAQSFQNGLDRIDVSALGVDAFTDMTVTGFSSQPVIRMPGGVSLTLTGISRAQIDASDFLFA